MNITFHANMINKVYRPYFLDYSNRYEVYY